MRFSLRSKMSKTFSLVSIVVILGLLLMAGALLTRNGSQAHASNSGSAQVTTGKASVAAVVNPLQLPKSTNATQKHFVIPFHSTHSSAAAVHSGSGSAPLVTGTPASDSHTLLHNFNGVSAVDSMNVNGFDIEPPDQGLCVGNGYVVEPVNLALTIYHRNGTVIAGPINLTKFFGEDEAFTPPDTSVQGDVRCYFDKATDTFFATQLFLTTTLTSNVSHFDVAVNTSGNPTTPWTIYRFGTTDLTDPGCPCFGDQPLFGIDQFNIYISTNEFPISVAGFNGTQIYAISKSQLEALGPVNFVHFGNLGIGGTIAASVQPSHHRRLQREGGVLPELAGSLWHF